MEIEFGEGTYQNALLTEIERSNFFGKTVSVTEIPTLRKEKNLGYDAKVTKQGKPLFLQFKVGERFSRSNANEWWYYNSPYFRFNIYPDSVSNQHNLLVALGNKFRNSVFYTAPIFNLRKDLEKYYLNNTLINNSKFINTRRLKTISGNTKHVITYSDVLKSKMWSEPLDIEESYVGDSFLNLISNIESINYETYLSKIKSVLEKTIGNITENINVIDQLLLFGISPVFIFTN